MTMNGYGGTVTILDTSPSVTVRVENVSFTECRLTADSYAFCNAIKEAEKKVKKFARQLKQLNKSGKKEKPVDFNKFLKTLCRRKK